MNTRGYGYHGQKVQDRLALPDKAPVLNNGRAVF